MYSSRTHCKGSDLCARTQIFSRCLWLISISFWFMSKVGRCRPLRALYACLRTVIFGSRTRFLPIFADFQYIIMWKGIFLLPLHTCSTEHGHFYLLGFSGRISTSKREKEHRPDTCWSLRLERRPFHNVFGACAEPDRKYENSLRSLFLKYVQRW